jgi:hypothetical protein
MMQVMIEMLVMLVNVDELAILLERGDLLRYPSHPPISNKARILRATSPLHTRSCIW